MTITTGIGKKFMEELGLGIHTLSEGTPDTIKAALYGPSATISPTTDAYTTDFEVAGGGYTAGGLVLPSGLVVVGSTGSSRAGGPQFTNPYINPAEDLQVIASGVGIRGLMLYNASQSNRNIFTLDFGDTFSPSLGVLIRWGIAGVVNETDVLIPILGNQI